MRLITGSQKKLQNHLLDFIKNNKKTPFERWLIVLPSKHLEEYLKRFLCQDSGGIIGITFLSMTGLASEINNNAKVPPKPLLEDSPLLDFKLKEMLPKFDYICDRSFSPAFKNSFRDLINAQVSSEVLESLSEESEGLLTDEQKQALKKLVPLYKEFIECQKTENKSTYQEYFNFAISNVENNNFLSSFKQIIFYGFYDFTNLHYELFKKVCSNYNAQVYFIYELDKNGQKVQALEFINNFYEDSILPLTNTQNSEHIHLQEDISPLIEASQNIFNPTQIKVENAPIKIQSICGQEELFAVAKEILRLHYEEEVPYSKMAITFRGEGVYNRELLEIFEKNEIPLNYNFNFPLLHKPYVAFVYNLFNLLQNNFSKEDVCAVINSQFFAFQNPLFANAIKESGITTSLEQYEEMLSKKGFIYNELLPILRDIKSTLQTLSSKGNFDILAKLSKEFIRKYTSKDAQKEQKVMLEKLDSLLDIISQYSTLKQQADTNEFLQEFFTLLRESSYNEVCTYKDAVIASDMMTLRFQFYDYLFIVGLNEGVLPLMPKQDPILKECYRQALQTIGYGLISNKQKVLLHSSQQRFFEEDLLFYLCLTSCNKQAYLFYNSSDEDGKEKVESLYITLLLHILGQTKESIPIISRLPSERFKNIPFNYLTREEASILISLQKKDNKELLNVILAPTQQDDFETHYFALQTLINTFSPMSEYDGVLGENQAEKFAKKEMSATNFSDIYKCPAQYFFNTILRENIQIHSRTNIQANELGKLYHKILELFYKQLKEKNLPLIYNDNTANLLNKVLREKLPLDKYKEYGIYPLIWLQYVDDITNVLHNFIKLDFDFLTRYQMQPNAFEQKTQKPVELTFGETKYLCKGTIDRIDISAYGKTVQIIDYKSGKEQTNLSKAIFDNGIFQPHIYSKIIEKQNNIICERASLAFLRSEAKDIGPSSNDAKQGPFLVYNKTDLQNYNAQVEEVLSFLLSLIKQGVYPIYKSDGDYGNCSYCEYKDICRKNHTPSLNRVENSEFFKKLKEYHNVKSSR